MGKIDVKDIIKITEANRAFARLRGVLYVLNIYVPDANLHNWSEHYEYIRKWCKR